MICRLQGKIVHRAPTYLIVDVAGIGHKIMFPEGSVLPFSISEEVSVYTHEAVRDDGHEFFGFPDLPSLELCWKLLEISGVGPRLAQKIVLAKPVEKLKEGIMAGDLSVFVGIAGVGKKTAQKIILELQGSLVTEPSGPSGDADVVEALVGLGYQRRQAEDASVAAGGSTTEEKIRQALRQLSRTK
ncbi:MAG TPA: Holliday junction branch migration protein RuvA [Patescibacteria group bacterium]|nr:Holliday junction branch migration protein RuvA [Patescibacteria group bacterium]